MKLKPWQVAAYELLKHGEQHRESGGSFDLRMALISYDNAIELSISTYLELHPDQRSSIHLPRDQVDKWKRNYHSKLQFFEEHVTKTLSRPMAVERSDIIHFHTVRNKLYHEGGAFVPHSEDVAGIRAAALWVFRTLFDADAEALLSKENTSGSVDIENTRRQDPLVQLDGMVLAIRKDFDSLRLALAPLLQNSATNEQVFAKALGTEVPAVSNTLQEAFRKAEEITNALGKEKEVEVDAKEIDELNGLLQQLKDRLSVPLRKYQEHLAASAVKASIEAIESGTRFIGNVYQPLGSGMSITMAAYLSLITQHSGFRDFTIIVVADRSTIADEYYHRVQTISFARDRDVIRLTAQSLATEAKTGRAFVGVGTIQTLSSEKVYERLPGRTLLIAVGFDLSNYALAPHLRNAYMISFSNSFHTTSSQAPPIAAYSFSEAVVDGYMTPATVMQVNLPALQEPDQANLELQSLLGETDTTRGGAGRVLTAFQVEAVAEHILEQVRGSPGVVMKALVIVASTTEAEQFRCALMEKAYSVSETDAKMRALTVFAVTSQRSATETARDLYTFCNRESRLSVLVSAKMWTGIDLSIVQRAYVTCPLSASELRRLVEKLSTLRSGREPPIIVDYAHNHFSDLYT